MDRIQVSKNWYLDEFVDPYTYFNTPDNGRSSVHPEIIAIAQFMRSVIGNPCAINNWYQFYESHKNLPLAHVIKLIEASNLAKWSGIRTSRCPIGASASAHKKEGAIDLKCPGMSGEELFNIAKKNAHQLYKLGLRRMEHPKDTPTWLHMDRRLRAINKIAVVDPQKFCFYINI